MCNMCRLLLTAAAVFVHLGSFHCEKEPNPLQKAGLIGQSLLSLGSKSSSSGAQLSHRRGHRNTRPKRVQVASVHMPISPHYHFPAEEAVLSPTYHSSLTAHHKPLLFTLDSNQYEMPISPIPIPVHLPDLDSDFVRGSADDYLFNRELEYKRGLQPIRPSSFHILSDSSPIELSDANILQLLDIDRPSVKPSSRPFSGSIRTPGAFSQSISLPFFTEAHPPNHPLPLSSPLSFPHALTTFTTHLNHPIHPTQHWSTHHALPSQSTLTRPGHVSHVLHHLHKPQSETSNEHAYELTDTKFTYPIGANRKPNNYLSLDLLPYSIKHEYQNDEVIGKHWFSVILDLHNWK